MESLPKWDEPFPTPPPYFTPGESQRAQGVTIYHIHPAFTPPPPPPSSSAVSPSPFSAKPAPIPLSSSAASPPPPATPRVKFVSHEIQLRRSPALTACPSCRTQVLTQVTYRAGTHAWLVCFVFVLCGLVLCCCLIPFLVDGFKDAYHTCPRCRLVLHVHKKTCCR